jgi:hypothetical protein
MSRAGTHSGNSYSRKLLPSSAARPATRRKPRLKMIGKIAARLPGPLRWPAAQLDPEGAVLIAYSSMDICSRAGGFMLRYTLRPCRGGQGTFAHRWGTFD